MMFRRKLWKRVLPAILSVAMVLETVPVTALAAEYEENEVVEETVPVEEPSEEHAANETQAADVNDDTIVNADVTIADVKDGEYAAENAENTAAALDTRIVINENALSSYCNSSSSYQYDIDKNLILVKYDESSTNPFENLLTRIKSSYIKVEVDDNTNASLTESLKYQWQKADGTDLAADAVPTEAGDYTLMVTLDAVENTCAKAEAKLSFTIEKRQLSVDFLDAYEVVPGTTIGAFKKDFQYSLQRESTSWNTENTEDITDSKTTYIDTVFVTVYDAYQMETPLADDVKFLERTDYVVSIKPVLKQTVSSNYAIPEETILKIKSYGRIETWIEAAQKNPEELITKVYDETSETQISYETEIKDKLTVTVKMHDKNTDEEVTLDNAEVTKVWFNGAKEELGEGAEFEPQTAGTYYLGFRYYPTEDDAKIYKACKSSDYIRVIIERAPLTLVPAFKDDAEVFYTGMSETDVLKYADYTLLNAKNEKVEIDKDTFWGVSYDDISADHTTSKKQSYEPVFQLIRAEKDASGNPVKNEDGKEIWTENGSTEKLDAAKYCYRLVFTGKKAVYTKTGAFSGKIIDVNGSDVDAEDKNHSIVTTEDVLSANYADVPVAEAKKTTIDVSGIVQQNFNTTNLNDLYQPAKLVSKVYDGEALYAPSRAEYKKAVVTSTEDNQEVAKDYDSAIRYTWYKINSIKAIYDETDPENLVQTGWEVDRKSQVGGTSNNIPTDAGEYMLEIRFEKTGYVSCTETIYYRIDKQLLVVDFETIPVAYKNESVESYTYAVHYGGAYNVYVVPDNQYSDSVKTEDNLLKNWYKIPFDDELSDYPYGRYYKLNWYVEQVQLDENNAPVKDENGNVVYTKLNDDDELNINGADTYRLGVILATKDSNYVNYQVIYDAEKSPTPAYTIKYQNDSESITVSETAVGTTPITIELDAEKITTTKDYDGKPFYAAEDEGWESVQNALTIKNTETGETIAQDKWPFFIYDIIDQETDDSIAFDEMVYGGSYTLSLYTLSDENYQSSYLDDAATYTINKIPLTVTPALTEDIPAGTDARNNNDGVIYNLSKTAFSGYIETDADAFQYGTSVYTDANNGTKTLGFGAYAGVENEQPYYNTLSATVSKEGTANKYNGYIKYGTAYAVQLGGALAYPYSRNYDVIYARKIFSATRRGNSTAGTVRFEGASVSTFVQRVDEAAVIIIPTNAIPYIKDVDTTDNYKNPITGEGNYFAIQINAPYEFREDHGSCLEKYAKNFIYRSSIEAAGGFILETANNYIKVVFPVKERAAKSFDIIWENGYTEKYIIDFTNAVLAENLNIAVAPKSLSFNGVNTKMAVGDEQQLDVKIKKEQIGDVIYIDYQVTQGRDVISVMTDDDKGIAGYATALKPGKATIAAVPVKLVNGVKTAIDGAKVATIAITVSDVTAPAIKKVTASDKKVTFTYTKPANGYRREVYILEGKKKAEDFETLIRSMNNGQWRGVFAVQPQYYVNELSDAKTKTVERTISSLSANGEYTLYVRNVSGIRTLADGSCVQLSAKGTVKTFKTTMPQVEALRLYAKNDDDILVTSKNVKLADKTEQLYTMGQFSTIDIDVAADPTDQSWLTLPLDKAYKKTFVAPKLVYAVSSEPDGLDEVDVTKIRDFRNYTYIGDTYYKKTDIATVDKTGKVTFKGVGKVYVIVYDQAAEEKRAQVTLNIYATADSIKAKDTKLAVGKGLYLSSLLTYSEGKTAITGMDYQNTGLLGTTYKPNLTISAEEVTKINNEGNFYLTYTGDGDYYIYAKKPNAECSIALNDGTLSASLKIQSAPIEPVKDFKITDIADDQFTISFSYPVETYLDGVKYRVDITDARGSLVASPRYDAVNYTSYDGKKKMFTQVVNYGNDKLVRLSKYNVSVTTLCAGEASAKPVKKAVKTTDFPASYENLGSTSYGGADVYFYSTAGASETYNLTLRYREYLTSGNTYTLEAKVSSNAKYRMTDTLTWKSSNTKVAAVKAKAGTYTAQLNALKPGITEIEVTSKITKKVIARWPVFVKAVGNAETYYGDYEFTSEYLFCYDPYYASGMEVLTLQNPVRVTASELDNDATQEVKEAHDDKWVKFTAPAYGKYQFRCTGTMKKVLSSSKKEIAPSKAVRPNYVVMLEGETLYFKVRGAFTMEVSDYIKQGTSFTVEDGSVSIDSDSKQYIEFRSTEDNVYTFYSKELPTLATDMKVYDEKNNALDSQKCKTWTDDEGMKNCDVSLSMGENIYLEVPAGEYTIYVTNRKTVALTENTKLELTDEVKERWYTYTAAESGLYTFQSKDATSVLTAEYYESLKDLNAADWNVTSDGNDFSGRMTLEAGQKIVFKMSASEAMTATIIVTPEIPVKLAVGEEKDIPVNADSRRWVTFTLPEAGRYRFSAVPTETDAAYEVNLRYYQNAIEENEITTIEKNEILVSNIGYYQSDIAKGDTVYVEITTNKEGLDAANVKVSLTQVTATELTIGEEQTITIKDGKEWWYTFTPPQKGNYIVQSVVTPNVGTDGEEKETHTLSGAWHIGLEQRNSSSKFFAIGTHDIYGESIGYSTQKLFKVSADDLGLGEDGAEITTTATIIVKELTATPLELNQPLEISLLKNERRWYSFTAPETNTYLFRKTIAEGSVYSSYGNMIKDTTMTDMNNGKDFFPIDLEKGQTIYIEEHENKGGPVTFTRLIDCVNNISGKVEETIQLTSDASKYYRYTADIDNYYMISYTTEPEDAEVTVSWRYAIDSMDYKFLDNYKQFPLEANEKRYFKLSTTSETPVSVTFRADPTEVVPLIAGEPKEIEVEPGGMTNYSWYSFTAETAGRYRISAQNEITNGGVHIDLFSSMIDEKTSVESERDYETGETVYVAVFNYNDVVRKATLSVEKIEPEPMGGSSVDEKISKETIKDYSYTASETGIYSLKNESYSGVEVYVYIDDDGERVYVGTPKEIFLKKDDVIYIKASYINAFFPSDPKEASVKFSVTLEDEPQTLSSENEPATIAYDGQDWKLIAFTAEETALYNFDIVYAEEKSAGYDDYVYYMNHSQIMWVNDALYGREAGEVVAENKGNHEVHARLLFEGETGYLYIPWLDTEATIEASRFPEVPIVETLKVNEPTGHAFQMKDEVDAVGDQVGDRVWYVFDAPGNGDYELTFDWEGASVQYQVKCYQNGLKQLSSAASFYQYINPHKSFDISGIKKKQRVCFVITKRKGSLDKQQLTVTVTKKQ